VCVCVGLIRHSVNPSVVVWCGFVGVFCVRYDVAKRVCRRLHMAVQPYVVLDALSTATTSGFGELMWWSVSTNALTLAAEMSCNCHSVELTGGGLHTLPRCDAVGCVLPHRVVLCTPLGFRCLVPEQPDADTDPRSTVGRHFQHHLAHRMRYNLQLDVGGFATSRANDGKNATTASQPQSTAQSLFEDLLTLSQQPPPSTPSQPSSHRNRVVADGDSDIDETESDTDSQVEPDDTASMEAGHDDDDDVVVFDDEEPEVDDGDGEEGDERAHGAAVDVLAHLNEDAKRFVKKNSSKYKRRRRWNDTDNCEGVLSLDFVESLLTEW
jgi:hypothetical protein